MRTEYFDNKSTVPSPQVDVAFASGFTSSRVQYVVFQKGKYTYVGSVELAGVLYEEDQPDKNEDQRKAWVFPSSGRISYFAWRSAAWMYSNSITEPPELRHRMGSGL